MKTRIENWAKSILVIPRWLLTLKYALFVVFAIVTLLSGVPSLNESAGGPYAFYWSLSLTVAALVACIASLSESKRAEQVEKWAAVAIVALLSAFWVGALVLGRPVSAVAVLIVSMLPGARAFALIVSPRNHHHTGRKGA